MQDTRFQTDLTRWEHRDILDKIVSDWVASHTAEELMAIAEKVPIPAGICLDHKEVANHPQVKQEAMLSEVKTPDGEHWVMVSSKPFKFSTDETRAIERSYPSVGQDNQEIYEGLLGYQPSELKKLKEQGVI